MTPLYQQRRSIFPEIAERGEGIGRGLGSASRHAQLRGSVIAPCCAVGALVGVAGFVIRFVQQTLPGTSELVATRFSQYHFFGFLAGRILGTAAVCMIVLSGRCHSIQFPAIIALAIEGLGDDPKLGRTIPRSSRSTSPCRNRSGPRSPKALATPVS